MTEPTDRARYADQEWLSIQVVEDEEQAGLIEGFLESEGIPCELDRKYSHEFPTHLGRLGEIEVRVPASRAEAARRLLAAREAAFQGESEEAGS
ncbi:MAG TPA: DUF2007 domain-containing protein [Thermoanaerobaculia bacterium]|nr:DUF2007 domain-containing protein [Thermoanaerobaculia bacterium]